MRIENIFEEAIGKILECRVFNQDEIPNESEEAVKVFFDKQKNEGYGFLKSYRKADSIVETLFYKI